MKMKFFLFIGMGVLATAALNGAAAASLIEQFRKDLQESVLDSFFPEEPVGYREAPILKKLNAILADPAQRERLLAEIDDRLIDACRGGYVNVAMRLLEEGANSNHENSTGTPLIAAVEAGSLPLVQLLMRKYEVDPHVVAGGEDPMFGPEKSALSVARQLGEAEIIQELEHAGARR